MKRLSLKSLTFVLALSMVIILLALPSCRSLDVPRIAQMDTDRHESHLLQRIDTIYRHDSIYIREVQRGDTVYLTRVEWRDRWRTHLVHDTIVRIDSIMQVIEHPPKRYVPKFYKWCTIILCSALLILLVYGIIRWYIKATIRH